MAELYVIWDDPGDPAGNWAHIFLRHDVTKDEVEEVLRHPRRRALSRSTGWPICFGWTSTGKYLAVVFEDVFHDPRTVKPITAYVIHRSDG
ncbi:MAG: hypothetical protein K2V38_12280 [Gemmataceae bacterium]|nr:hypothetical protein [Gemmataceae bacterium]